MERHCDNARAIAHWLDAHPKIAKVYYPGLPSHPQHELAKRQMHGFGGMVTAVLVGGLAPAKRFLERCEIFALAESLGGVESLIEHRASIEGAGTPVPRDLLRLSAGIENGDELLADLVQALGNQAERPSV
jgi:cystathionine beta-lyase/cystathionine gamma-synthase